MSLQAYGWNDFFLESMNASPTADLEPARVMFSASGHLRLMTESGERRGKLAGRLRHEATSGADLPAVGDWVAVRIADDGQAQVERVLSRRSTLSRKVSGKRSVEQVVAANVDVVVVVMGLDGDFNLRRLERYLATVRESGARPVVLLNKVDLCTDDGHAAETEAVALGAPVLLASCKSGTGLDALLARIEPGETAVLVGSSGVGKSTIINGLLGSVVQKTRGVRHGDDRGRHTTSHRELFRLPSGAMLIDSPGIRELQLWGSEDSLTQTFEDIDGLAARCRFRDCSHQNEDGCAVLVAIEKGDLDAARLESYRVLQKELRHLELRQSESAQRVQKQKWRSIHREYRRSGKNRRR